MATKPKSKWPLPIQVQLTEVGRKPEVRIQKSNSQKPEVSNKLQPSQQRRSQKLTVSQKQSLRQPVPSNLAVAIKKQPPPPSTHEEEPDTVGQKFADTAKQIYKNLGLKHFGFVVVLIVYSFIGAAIFHAIEGPVEAENKIKLVKTLNTEAVNLTAQIEAANSTEDILELIRQYQRDSGLMPSPDIMNRHNWDFWGSMFYAGTLYTTIGYGHYAPETDAGRWVTMVYALIGIPLVLATLADLGKLLTRVLKRIWTWIVWTCRSCVAFCSHMTCRRAKHENPEDGPEIDDLETLATVEAEQFNLPIPIAVGLFFGWLLLCGAIFMIWETTWSYFLSFYFFFVSLSTIGLGDVTPDHPKYLLLCFPLVVMGLSLVSMVINLIQNKMEEMKEATTEFIEDELGWDTESSSDEDEFPAHPSGFIQKLRHRLVYITTCKFISNNRYSRFI